MVDWVFSCPKRFLISVIADVGFDQPGRFRPQSQMPVALGLSKDRYGLIVRVKVPQIQPSDLTGSRPRAIEQLAKLLYLQKMGLI